MSILINSTKYCSVCGSFDILWSITMENKSGVREATVLYSLDCADCSETLRIVSGQDLLQMMNKDLMK